MANRLQRVAIYLRVSTDEQHAENQKLRSVIHPASET